MHTANMHTAPTPNRIAQKLTIQFGSTDIAVALYTGAEETKPKATQTTGVKAPAPVGVRPKNKATNRSVPKEAVYETVEATDGTKVKFSAEERKAAQLVDGPYPVEAIIPAHDLGHIYFPTAVYQIRANTDVKVGGEANARKLALLFSVLGDGYALVQAPLKTGQAPVVLLVNADGYALVCHFSNAVRQQLALDTEHEFSAAEVARAAKVADKLRGTIVPTHDQGADRIQAAIDAKAVAGTDVVKNTVPVTV